MTPNNRPLRIARAAIRFHKIDEPDNWQIMYGFNHAEVFRQMKDLGIVYDKKDYQTGFITNEKPMHFVDRQEGAKIALAAGQIKEPKDTLYSEDLWLPNGYERKYD